MTIAAMPDFRADIEDLIAEGDKVVARLTFRGTHTCGEFMGIPPSGRSFAFSATSIFRIADGGCSPSARVRGSFDARW